MNKQIICFLVFIMTFSSGLFAQIIKKQGGRYEFKGREYQLNPYQDAPPKGKFGFVMEEGLEKNLSNYPQRLNLKQLQTPVKDQGSRGSCAYFSAVALAESAIKSYQGDVVNISEDGWFGKSIGPEQHFTHSIFRAIESGKYVLRSANNGVTAIINPMGVIEQKVEINKSGYIDLSESRKIDMTLFAKFGNKIFGFIILLYIFLIFSFNKLKNE